MTHYRGDIDGLRAIAILPVLLFHAGIAGFGGGYVGVDVFFVISGYLITGIILPEVEGGRFSLVSFYERRVRRIFPALFTVLAVSAVIASWLLLPRDLAAFGQSLLATAFFASNFDFWQQAGYFGPTADEIPLLHTWSLAVEEQFYILFPLFLLACARGSRRRLVVATLLVVAGSLALSIAGVAEEPEAAFYLAPARAWELGLGALLAMGAIPSSHHLRRRNAVAVLGAAAILCSVFAYTRATPFPGAAALLPCAGAAAIIWAGSGGHNLVGTVLSTRPLVLTGLVSYSLYLWHWPLLAFARYALIRPLTAPEAAAILGVAALGAVASWRYVERPFRGKSGLFDRRRLFLTAGVVLAAASACGASLLASSGWPSRMSAEIRRITASADDRRTRDWACGDRTAAQVVAGELCRLGRAGTTPPSFLVWGDSHARVLADAVATVADRHGRAGLLAVRSACAPLLEVQRSDRKRPRECVEFNREVLATLARRPELTDVLLIGRWALAAEGTRYKYEPGETVWLTDDESQDAALAENHRVFPRALRRTVEALVAQGKHVWIVESVPEIGWDVPSALARAMRFGRAISIVPSRAEYQHRQARVRHVLDDVARSPDVRLLRPDLVLCPDSDCRVVDDGLPIYFDYDHLTRRGGALLEPLFEDVFTTGAAAR